jgi:Concanavalin A-like lectin/glucanases superfamily
MWKQSIHLIPLVVALLLLAGGTAFGQFSADSDASLVALWRLNDGAEATAVDDSPNANNGALQGNPQWVPGIIDGALSLDGDGDYVDCGNDAVFDITEQITLAIWVNANDMLNGQHNCWLGKGDNAYAIKHQSGNLLEFFIYSGDWYSTNYTTDLDTLNGQWHHMAGTFDGDELLFYLDGEVAATLAFSGAISTATHNVTLGENSQATGRYFDGMLDDARIYNRALTQEEIQIVMLGGTTPELASDPIPESEATDVPRDNDLSWTPGESAVSHDVYLGTSLDDVNDASRSNPMDVLIGQGQSGTTYDPGRLEFGQTYYWRIDEVNGAPDNTIFKGEVWSFEVEPFAYPIENITVTANTTSDPDSGPEKMIDGSGLNGEGQHSVDAADMWLGVPGADPVTLAFEFDQVYKLSEMVVWNYNVIFELMLGFGLKDVTVEYSENGTDWTVLDDVQFAQATAMTTYTANTTVDFGGAAVKAVKLTVNSGYGPMGQFGLSEIRSMYIPALAREPQPADDETNVDVTTVLAWRDGREAAAHEVYLSTDSEAVASGMALVDTVGTNSYASDDLEFGTSYYWKVNEVNEVEAISVWEGNVWSFMTQEFAVIDGFESYNDEDNVIYETWIDGWVNETGSTVGYLEAPFAEQTIVNSGSQSMPLQYDNSAAPFYSEAERDLGGMDLDTNGAETLRLFVSGQAPAFVETADGTIAMNAIGADIWNAADEFRYAYKNLTGDGSMIARVDALDGSPSTWAKAGVMVRQDTGAGAINTFIAMTGGDGGGATFQQRVAADDVSVSQHTYDGNPFASPYWVRLERVGNAFSAFISPDGETWQQAADTVTVAMDDPVLIGLALTSHLATQATSAQFSNVSFTGNVTGAWQIAEVGVAQPTTGNAAEPLYMALEDSAGNVVVVNHPNPAAVALSSWQEWLIPLSDLTGVNLNSVATMYIGVGDRDNPTSGGTGTVFIDDIGYGRPTPAPADDL